MPGKELIILKATFLGISIAEIRILNRMMKIIVPV
jgi:hypothetical protein